MTKQLLGKRQPGLLFVISAPAGTGKSTLVDMILSEFAGSVAESCSCTTRPPRPGEIEEQHYLFLSQETFQEKVKASEFLEYAEVFGHFYGTREAEVKRLQKEGKHVVLVIDTQGAMKVQERMAGVFIFISPPSFEELRRRLEHRKTESKAKIEERLEWAKHEVTFASRYDYHIVNDHLETTYQVLRSIFIAEGHRVRNC